MTHSEIRVFDETQGIHRAAAKELVDLAVDAVNTRGVFHVALSGGSTPKGMFALLVSDEDLRERMPWDKTHFWWSDERHVAPDDADSNFKMANEAMLSKAPIPEKQIHRIHGENADAGQAAIEYQDELQSVFGAVAGAIPQFDLILLGMGNEGHTASLFPGTRALEEMARLVVANWVGKLFTWRITFTAPLINEARSVWFLVAGDDKALALKGVLEGPIEPAQLPAQLVQPRDGNLVWFVDRRAAAKLASPR